MVKSAENRMRSTLELFPVINVKSRPRYISNRNYSAILATLQISSYALGV